MERQGMWDLFERVNGIISGVAVPFLLILVGVFYLLFLRGFHLRHPVRLFRAMVGPRRGGSEEGVSPFRAVTLALAGTLGVGNLVGVAGAIALGGAGSIFWMVLTALLAMLLKYAEIVLALRHRETDAGGVRHGGAMYYIRDGLRRIGLPRFGAVLAAVFAVFCVIDSFTMGSVIQMNAVGAAFHGVFGVPRAAVGAVLAAVTLPVVLGGGKRISALTERLVPLMTLLYLVLSVAVLILRREALPAVFRAVLADAFTAESAVSGVGGFLFSRAVRYGTIRGLMSNEAGCGTAPIAHAESNAERPAVQGLWGIFEVFADTVLLCTLTAAVILVSYGEVAAFGADAMMMTVKAYSTVLGGWSEPLFAFLVLFFAFATVICWAHYGASALGFLTRRRGVHRFYTVLFSASVFVGTVTAPEVLWTLSDLSIGVMTLVNLAVLFGMRGEVKAETLLLLSETGRGLR